MAVVTPEQGTKRLHLSLPIKLYQQVQTMADEQGMTVTDLLQWFIRLGLLAIKLQNDPDGGLVIRRGGQEEKVHFLI